jgi:GTP pyrophosphokinase
MVSTHTAKHENAGAWLEGKSFSAEEADVIRRAASLAEPLYLGKLDITGTPLLQHALGTADILLSMNMDCEAIAASILQSVPKFLDNWQELIEAQFGAGIRNLVEGMLRLDQIQQLGSASEGMKKEEHALQIESLRKMILSMVQDIRVVLIKLAERAQTLRTLQGARPEMQQQIAREAHNLFAPLANRLGVWQIKWEIEDLSVRYLEPQMYKKIAKLLDERRIDRERYIGEVIAQMKQALGTAGIAAEVTGRPKHIYSIINKMRRKHLAFDQLYDVRAVRIMVEDVESCYAALSLVQSMWQPIASEFDDYIAHPKSNNYRSLHTAVMDKNGLAFEVQIRTHEMHRHSELGVAAHWRYKEGRKADKLDDRIIWLRQILEWKQDIADTGDLQERFRNDLFQDQVYVFTPQGKVIALPQGATPVDFAYALHTDLGHRTRGAKVNGNIVPLNYPLRNGQRVEILTAKIGSPSRDWLNPALGFLHGSRARAKVRAWFKSQNLEESIAQGRTQLDKELTRLGATAVNQEKLAQRLHFNKTEELLAAIGRNEVTMRRIAQALHEELPHRIAAVAKPVFKPASERSSQTGILIEGVGNLVTRKARCCNPEPPEDIVAYVTRDRGITIHRKNCAHVLRMPKSERLLKAKWSD